MYHTKEKELLNCTFVKTMLMLLVVFYHSILFWSGGWFSEKPAESAEILRYVAQWLNSFHVYGFTLVSGYIFCALKCEKGLYNQFLPFVANKAKRLLIPYAVIAILWVIPIGQLFFHYDAFTIFKKYVLAMGPSQLWFLIMLFEVFVIAWLLADLFRKHDLLSLIAVVGLYGGGLVGPYLMPNIFMIWTALRYVPLFWLGFKLRQHGTTVIRRIPSALWIAASVLLFGLVQWLGGMDSIIAKLLNLGLSFLMNIVGALMAFVVLQKIADKVNWNHKFFALFSKRSMVVYLLHQQIIYFFIYWLNGVINPYINAMVNFAGALGVSLLLATVLLKFHITRFLVGEK